MNKTIKKPIITSGKVDNRLLIFGVIVAIFYISWWFLPGHRGNEVLFYLLLAGEFYHLFMALSFWLTVSEGEKRKRGQFKNSFVPSVDVFITVAGEPVEIVRQTVSAARDMDYPNHKVFILNDGLVANKDNWREIELLAMELGVDCITRKVGGGAKAGNVNNGLSKTGGEIVAIFDADMAAYTDFLKKTIPYFQDNQIGFVQCPQYYKNHETNEISGGAWEQQELFFGPIMRGKEKHNAAFICGTNFAIRRKTLLEVGGLQEDNIAEDFQTSLLIHQKGWRSVYVNEVLSEGLAPEDAYSYYKQQLRWARGSLQILFSNNPLMAKGLNWKQKIEYLSSSLYYLNGLIVLIDIVMPLVALFFGIKPVAASSTSFSLFFLPFMFLNLYILRLASGGKITLRALSLSYSSWLLQLKALISILLKKNMTFAITSKKALNGDFSHLAYPHLAYIGLAILAGGVGIEREGLNSSVITNMAWLMVNSALFLPFINKMIKPKIYFGTVRPSWAT